MEPDVITTLIAAGASTVTGLGGGIFGFLAARRSSKAATAQAAADSAGKWNADVLADGAAIRRELRDEVGKLRDEIHTERAAREKDRDQCERDIREAITRAEAECERTVRDKLSRQARELRGEIDELRRRVGDMSEPLT